MRPLEGMLVVSVEQAVAAPLCSCRLADAGARVIKIERPEGDFARGYDRAARGQSSYFVWLNRGKESVVLDIKSPTTSELLARLIARADVFVQNLMPGAMARAGFDLEELRAAASAARDLLDFGVWRDRPLSRHEILRHADPGRNRPRLAHRTGGGAGPRRRLGYRYRGRAQRLCRDPRSTGRARSEPAKGR